MAAWDVHAAINHTIKRLDEISITAFHSMKLPERDIDWLETSGELRDNLFSIDSLRAHKGAINYIEVPGFSSAMARIYERNGATNTNGYRMMLLVNAAGCEFVYDYEHCDSLLEKLNHNVNKYITDSIEKKAWKLVLNCNQSEYTYFRRPATFFNTLRDIQLFLDTKPIISPDITLLLVSSLLNGIDSGYYWTKRETIENFIQDAKELATGSYPTNSSTIIEAFELSGLRARITLDPENTTIESSRLERMLRNADMSPEDIIYGYLTLCSREYITGNIERANEYDTTAVKLMASLAKHYKRPSTIAAAVCCHTLHLPEMDFSRGNIGLTKGTYKMLVDQFDNTKYAKRCLANALLDFLTARSGESAEVSNLQIARDYYNVVKDDPYETYRQYASINSGLLIAVWGQVDEGMNILKLECKSVSERLALAQAKLAAANQLAHNPDKIYGAAHDVIDIIEKNHIDAIYVLLDAHVDMLQISAYTANWQEFDRLVTIIKDLQKQLEFPEWETDADWLIAINNATRIVKQQKRIEKLKDLLERAEQTAWVTYARDIAQLLANEYFMINDKANTREMFETAIAYSESANQGINFELYNDYLSFLHNYASDLAQWRRALNALIVDAESTRTDRTIPFLRLLANQIINAINSADFEDTMVWTTTLFDKAGKTAEICKGDFYAGAEFFNICLPIIIKCISIMQIGLKSAPESYTQQLKRQADLCITQYEAMVENCSSIIEHMAQNNKPQYLALRLHMAEATLWIDGADACQSLLEEIRQWAEQNNLVYNYNSSSWGLRRQIALDQEDYDEVERLTNTPEFDEMLKAGNLSVHNLSNDLSLLTSIYLKRQEYDKAQELENKRQDIVREYINDQFMNLSEAQRDEMFSNNIASTFYLNLLVRLNPTKENSTKAYDAALFYKTLLISSSQTLRRAVYESEDSTQIADYEKLLSLRYELSKHNHASTIAPEYISKLRTAQELEDSISTRAAASGLITSRRKYKFSDIAKALSDDEAAIEFIVDSEQFGALIARRKAKRPIYVPLLSVKELSDILSNMDGASLYKGIQKIYSYSKSVGKKTYHGIWAPIEPYLEGAKRIYYTPDGDLHKISFAAIEDSTRTSLCQKYDLRLVSTTGQIVNNKMRPKSLNTNGMLYAMGGITYDADSLKSPNRPHAWKFLANTPVEVACFDSICSTVGLSPTIYMGDEATEERFRSLLDTSPTFILLATHGFFLSSEQASIAPFFVGKGLTTDENRNLGILPMNRGGVILANANPVWTNEIKRPDDSDGVLTASEIAELNLSETKLLVLSACDTGRGESTILSGVNGLQRGFKLAGVNSIIMSLWEVNDQAGQEFMKIFYTHLFAGVERHDAFRMALVNMKELYPRDPGKWAPFIMLD